MAAAVEFRTYKPQNSREDLVRRIGQAPLEHAQAVLAAYELLENLHDKGILDILNGLLSAGDTVVNHVVNVVSSKEMVNALRIALTFSNLLSAINPDQLRAVLDDAGKETPSLLSIGRMAASEDTRRGMATALGLLSLFGAALKPANAESHR